MRPGVYISLILNVGITGHRKQKAAILIVVSNSANVFFLYLIQLCNSISTLFLNLNSFSPIFFLLLFHSLWVFSIVGWMKAKKTLIFFPSNGWREFSWIEGKVPMNHSIHNPRCDDFISLSLSHFHFSFAVMWSLRFHTTQHETNVFSCFNYWKSFAQHERRCFVKEKLCELLAEDKKKI